MKNDPFRTAVISIALAASSASPALAAEPHAHGHGDSGSVASVTRIIHVDMADTMRFAPARIEVGHNETVRFVVVNSGKLRHEMTLGTPEALKQHAADMQKMPGMAHTEPNTVSVAPGQTGTLVWTFAKAGVVDFACLQPGHFEAGMKGLVKVSRQVRSNRP